MKSPSPSASQVRVAVRIRPLTRQEVEQGGKMVLAARAPEVRLGERRFTYDAVFDASVTQADLYSHVSDPLQTSFLDGYNATIMAYGQTGSGKTFTMGSEAHTELEVCQNTGLIPRFMNDLFEQLQRKKDNKRLSEYNLHASFLEVYGEDVHDLLDPSRKSLPLREDANGGIICTGLTDRQVLTAAEALQVLHEGTMNRTTAATLMNLTSSRSHAVFTVTLTQVCKADGVQVTTTSRFTFVDLAGSERMKKTGAEGERAREGIKINEGLLALGNVINALADEDRLAEGKKIHVPYRQSKLTRLLQDALGGNSQTLFLACVSPSDTNASETLSTLHYANRARNIKNAPTKNVDAGLLELQRLQAYNRILQAELVRHKFGEASSDGNEEFEQPNDELMMRKDVNDYLCRLHSFSQESIGLEAQPLVLGHKASTSAFSSSFSSNTVELCSPRKVVPSKGSTVDGTPNRTIMETCDPNLLSEVNPDEEMAILNQLLELQQKDHDFDNEKKKDVEELKQMEGELAEQEAMLLQLRDSLKVYHDMKTRYEKLMAEVQQLESEKEQLAEQLVKATADPTQGCSTAIKKELEKVERSLSRARNETRRHRQMYRKAEQEAQKCRTLERKVMELKIARANLVKRQKEAATRHREYTETKTREILQLKKKERVAKQKMSKLESEIQIHKKNLDKRQVYNKKLAEKLNQTETHLMKLLAIRRREFRDRASTIGVYRRGSAILPTNPNHANSFVPEESEELKSLQFLLEKDIADHIHHEELRHEYENRVNEYTETMRSIVGAVGKLDDPTSGDLEDEIEEKELKVELLASEMESLREKMALAEQKEQGNPLESIRKLIMDKEAPLMRTLLLNFIKKIAEIKLAFRKSAMAVERKESVINSFESEVESLNSRIISLTRQIAHRHSLSESGDDPAEMIESLQEERSHLLEHSNYLEKEMQSLKEAEDTVIREKMVLEAQLATALEKASLAQLALQQSGGVEPPEGVLAELQSNWEKLGTSFDEREKVRTQIENCLEDTCLVKLEDSTRQVVQTQQEISELEQALQLMYQSLGEYPPPVESKTTLLGRLKALEQEKKRVEPRFSSAIERRNNLANDVKSLSIAMGLIELDTLNQDLQSLVNDVESQDNALPGPCNLGDEFLTRCERHVSALRLEKSKVLANNSTIQRKAWALVAEMNLTEEDILPIVAHSIHKRCSLPPEWWNADTADAVARAVTTEGGVVRSTLIFAQHLNAFMESLESVSKGRSLLSTKLRDLVKRAHKTLLETVHGEGDATEAYSSFHDALFRLPLLSKEHVYACISEMKALMMGVEAMTQSEIEALTVVWEALSISTSLRGEFWGKIEDALLSKDSTQKGPFHDIVQSGSFDGEEWVLVAAKEATQTFVQLETRLFKLEKIHEEVETMSARQDAKSKIISLDSELRLLNAKLSEFEDEKCGKERLVTKKNTSSHLLKEERFRKQMQTKFSSKLEQLANLLKSWHNEQTYFFDPNLLSDEVRVLLANFDDIDALVEKRTEFMHLRTIQAKNPSKRASDSRVMDDQRCPPAKRRGATSDRSDKKSRKTKSLHQALKEKDKPCSSPTSNQKSSQTNKRKAEQNRRSPLRLPKVPRLSRDTHVERNKQAPVPMKGSSTKRVPLSPARTREETDGSSTSKRLPGKKLTLIPFGRVLDQARTPRKNKENED